MTAEAGEKMISDLFITGERYAFCFLIYVDFVHGIVWKANCVILL